MIKTLTLERTEIQATETPYLEIDAGVIGAPEDVVIDDDEVSGDRISLVEYVFVYALGFVYGDRKGGEMAKGAQEKRQEEKDLSRRSESLSSVH